MKQAELSVVERPDDFTQIALSGRLDAMGVDSVAIRFQGMTSARGKHTIVDMSNVEFVASLGLSMLLSAARSLHKRGARMVIVNPQPLVLKVLETAHMPAVIPVVATALEAEAFFT